MIWARVHTIEKKLGIKIPTIEVLEQWAEVVTNKGVPETILVADSYYITEDAHSSLSDLGVCYICSTKERFHSLVEEVKSRVEKPGQWAASWNDETGELLEH